eukprot:7199956-Ditylum_brightwellii.AAC.1
MAKVLMAAIMIRPAHPQTVLLPQVCTMVYFQDMTGHEAKRGREEETTKQRQHKQGGPMQSRSSARELVKDQ